MHAEKLLHRWLSDVLPETHLRRVESLSAVISGALRGACLTVTSLGRFMNSAAKAKHNIKRADRLLSNEHLHSERIEIYTKIARQIIGNNRRPVVLVDWSDIDARCKFYLLRAAIAVKGRSLTIFEEVYPVSSKEKRKTHGAFLATLKEILPQDCNPIMVTDAGFRGPWFQQVLALGWDFVGRVRNRDMVLFPSKTVWIGAKSLYQQATRKVKLFADVHLTRSNPIRCNLVAFKAKPKGRLCLGKMGKKKNNITSLKNSARSKEPWLLATSLLADKTTAREIVKIYSTRMQIEESFRDLKCPRRGMSLYFNGTYKIQRMRLLVMIGSIAATFAWLIGKATRMCGKHLQFQANTTRNTPILSNVFIGVQIFRDIRYQCSATAFTLAKMQMQIYSTENSESWII